MKRNVIVKILLDVTMLTLYLLLMFAHNLSGFFHEVVGMGIGVLFVIHVVINRAMLKGLFKSAKKGRIGKIILAISDIALTICMPIVIITGILIAKELFVIQSKLSWTMLFDIHNTLSYVCLWTMLLHLLMHTKYLLGVFKKLPSAFFGKEMRSALGRFSAGAFVAVILYSSLSVYKNISDKHLPLNKPKSTENKNSVSTAEPAPIDDKKDISTVLKDDSVSFAETTPAIIEESSLLNDEDDQTLITDESADEVIAENTEADPPPTLEEYLSGLYCTGCGRGCSLISPRCGKGQAQAAQAEEEYNLIYMN